VESKTILLNFDLSKILSIIALRSAADLIKTIIASSTEISEIETSSFNLISAYCVFCKSEFSFLSPKCIETDSCNVTKLCFGSCIGSFCSIIISFSKIVCCFSGSTEKDFPSTNIVGDVARAKIKNNDKILKFFKNENLQLNSKCFYGFDQKLISYDSMIIL